MRTKLTAVVVCLVMVCVASVQAQDRERGNRREPTIVLATAEVAAAYEALSTLDFAQRNALFRPLPSDVKAGLWRMHLQVFLGEQFALTSEQRAVLTAIVAKLEPSLYEAHDATEQAAARFDIELLIDRAGLIFTPDDFDRLFYRLGPAFERSGPRKWAAQVNSNCDCSTSQPACTCQGGGCTKTQDGCGPMKMYGCNGLCQ